MAGIALAGARVLITGAGSGLGRQLALQAARRGAEIVAWDRSGEASAAVCDEIRAAGGTATTHLVDVTDKEAVRAAAERSGPVDVLVNNAGVVSGSRLLELTDEQIEQTFAVNVLALYRVTRAFLPGMIERNRGTVVTVASAAGLVGVARQTDYSASKWAAVGFTESLRGELRADGHDIGTLVVCPYYIDTGMFAGVTTRFPKLLPILRTDKVARRIVDAIERGREQLIMPPMVRVVPAVRMLPSRGFDALMDLFGINHGMDHFTGRTPTGWPERER